MCRGKIRSATCYVNEREKGGFLFPIDTDKKTGELVRNSLVKKHPDGRDVDIAMLPEHNSPPELSDVQVTDDHVKNVSKNVSGSSDPSGLDSLSLSHWLLKYGGVRQIIRRKTASTIA